MSFRNSLYFKISLWYFFSILIVLLAFSLFVYFYVSNYIWQQLDERLLADAENIVDIVSLLKLGLGLLSSFALLLSFGGIFFLRRALNPLYEMVSHMEKTDADILENLIPQEKKLDNEFEVLVENYNAMLMRLRKSFDKLRELGMDISHQLRTPLTILQGEMEVALTQDRPLEYYKEVLESNLEEVKKMITAIEKLLFLGRLKSGVYTWSDQEIILNQLLGQIKKKFELLMQSKNIGCLVESSEDVYLKADPFLLENLYVNLVDNAVKYSVSGGKIGIKIYKEGKWAVSEISNAYSKGLPRDIDKIFDRYYSSGKGGLGLAIVSEIIRIFEGEITVRTLDDNRIVFRVSLPLKD